MVATFTRGGVTPVPAAGGGFAPPVNRVWGNPLPADSGIWPSTANWNEGDKPGPHPASQPMGGTSGAGDDGFFGSDPRAPLMQPYPRRVAPTIEGQTSSVAGGQGGQGYMAGRPLGYAEGAIRDPDDQYGSVGNADRLGRSGDPLPHGRQSYWRGGIQGFSDKLTVKDRHAYWDTGYQRTGVTGFAPAGIPNTYNDPLSQPPMAELRTINRTYSYQKGTDTTRNQDDLSRPYTWLGEQGSGWTPIPGGVPGLYMPYGSRGGVPYPIVDPTNGQGGREQVWSGPPHGLHSLTFPDMGDTLDRYQQNVQMRPVRVDRPANSPQAGQSYSQTVQYQGATGASANVPPQPGATGHQPTSRGWAGAVRPWPQVR